MRRAGRLKLVMYEELEPVLNGEADAPIKASIARESDKPSGAPADG